MSEASSATVQHGGHVHDQWHTDKVGMASFLISEVAFFSTLVVAYVFYLDQIRKSDPSPADVFYMPLVILSSICLFSSSATIHLAGGALHRGDRHKFLIWWGGTIILGALFLVGTALEWRDLLGTYDLTISRNMFGTCYFTLVGFHAAHVTMGVMMLSAIFGIAWSGRAGDKFPRGAELITWYWHFVDGVWVVVFTVVYLVGRY
ncbi:MAG: heme-copper oxidase subunit III [Gemmataceae bacterium]